MAENAVKGVIKFEKKPKNAKYYIGSAISIIIMLFFGKICPTWATVTPMGVNMIGVFLGTVIGIILTNDILWTSIFALGAMVFVGYYAQGSAAIAGSLGQSAIFQVIVTQALIYPVINSGAGDVFARFLLTRKFFQKKPMLLIYVFFMVFVFAACFMNVIGACMLAFPILEQILEVADYDVKSKLSALLHLGVYLAIKMGERIKAFSEGQAMVRLGNFNAAFEGLGVSVNIGTFALMILIINIVFFFIYTLCIKYLFRCDLDNFKKVDFREIPEMMQDRRLNRDQLIFVIAFLLYVLYPFYVRLIPNAGTLGGFMNNIGIAFWGALICVALQFFTTKDESGNKKELYPLSTVLKTAVTWDLVFVLAAFMAIGGAITGDAAGINVWLTSIFDPILSGRSSIVFIFLIILVVTLITNYFSDNATGLIFSALCAPLAATFVKGGMNPAIAAVAIEVAISFAFLSYSACNISPLLLGDKSITNKFVYTYGLAVILIFCVVASACLFVLDFIF